MEQKGDITHLCLWLCGGKVLSKKDQGTPGPRIMRIHLVRNSTSARFGKKPFNIRLVQTYSTSASEKKTMYLVKIHLVPNSH